MPGTLLAKKSSVARTGRGLERAKKGVEDLVQRWNAAGDPAGLVNELAATRKTLDQERKEFNKQLEEFEQQAAEENDNTFQNDLQHWETLEYDSRQVGNQAEQLLESFAAQTATAPQPNPDANGGQEQGLNRLVALLEQRQQQAPASTSAAQDNGGNGGSYWARLPKIELPKFSGDPLEFPSFWDHFDSAIGKNPKLAPVDKLSYLKGLLDGDAKKLVKSLPMTNDSYAVAERTLKSRYEDKKMTVSLLYRKLTDMKPVKNEQPTTLKAFLADLECILGSLEAQGQDIEDQNFVTIIMAKLPLSVVTTLEMFKAVSDPWTVKLLRERLSEYMIRLDRAERASSNGKSQRKENDHEGTSDGLTAGESKKRNKGKSRKENPGKKESPDHAGAGGKDKGSSKPDPKPYCAFCEGSHWSSDCKKYATAEGRYARIREKDRCTLCLREGHKKKDCRSTKSCFNCGKAKNHHSSLCLKKYGEKEKDQGNVADDQKERHDSATEDESDGAALLAAGQQVTLQTAKVSVARSFEEESGIIIDTRVLFDPGSGRSYCSDSFAKKLSLRQKKGPFLLVNRFGCDKPISVRTKSAILEIRDQNDASHKIEVSIVPKITGEVCRRPVTSEKLKSWSKEVNLADDLPIEHETAPVELLIGSDYYLDFVTGEKIVVEDGLYLLGSVFGFILTGRSAVRKRSDSDVTMCGLIYENVTGVNDLVALPPTGTKLLKEPDLSDFWSLETIGIRDKVEDIEDDKAIECFEAGVKHDNERYSVPLPWKENAAELQTDYNLSIGRLGALVRKLKDDEHLFKTYNDTIVDQQDKGVIEKVDLSSTPGAIIHYIPHHAVVQPQKETTKVRVVYDGSAKSKADCPSLNECLYRGPVLLEDLVGHLIRFRLSEVAITADIEKAFLQIEINEEDRDALRFLWIKDPEKKSIDHNVQVFRFKRVLFGLNCSPALLALTIQFHLKKLGTPVAVQVLSDLYVDNVISGVATVKEAKEYYDEVKSIFRSASMNMRQWTSNSEEFNDYVKAEDRVKSKHAKVLGIYWDREKDVISICGGSQSKTPDTKRSMLSAIARIYDPLGLMAPITIAGKVLLQQLSKGKSGWDTKTPKEYVTKCAEHIERIKEIPNARIPRKTRADGKVTLIAFTDASSSSYAASIYLRNETETSIEVNLIMCKSRVNPGDRMTIPKLELMGIVIGVRALNFVKDQLRRPIHKEILFCDAKSALGWVKSGKGQGVFCSNRLKEIIKIAGKTIFRYVNTEDNPADWATRGRRVDELTPFWWHGPSWLAKEESSWPDWEFEPFVPPTKMPESQSSTIHEASLVTPETKNPPFGIQIKKYSTLPKLLRVTAWCQRFINVSKSASSSQRHLLADEIRDAHENSSSQRHLLADEIEDAKRHWEKSAQNEKFPDVFEKITEQKKHRLVAIGAFVDENGLLRCQNRMANADLPWDQKYPKILPKEHPYTKLVIENLHRQSGHASAAHTLSLLKREFWLAKSRAQVETQVRQCVICKKATGKPFAIPPMPELPKSRVTPSPSFTHTGIDYFGPLKVKARDGVEKVWICLFTCLATRAVHLELIHDLSADQFLLCLRRFISRRGKPQTVISDNGPQFKVTSETLKDAWTEVIKDDEVMNFSATNGIKWDFIPAFAPYMGGVYERMVGIAKSSLRKIIGKALLTTKELETFLCEAEALVNSRPLTYVSLRLNGADIITPAHFLTPHRWITSSPCAWTEDQFQSFSPTAESLVENWEKGQNLLDEFWRIWSTDYLDQLRSKNTYLHRHNTRLPQKPAIGDMVLIKDTRLPRGSWKIARIERLTVSFDKDVRSAKVMLPSGRIITRPVTLLIPFEVPKNRKEQEESPQSSTEDESARENDMAEDSTSGRPQRAAATEARKKISDQLAGKSG